jgi:hypothetical protein
MPGFHDWIGIMSGSDDALNSTGMDSEKILGLLFSSIEFCLKPEACRARAHVLSMQLPFQEFFVSTNMFSMCARNIRCFARL